MRKVDTLDDSYYNLLSEAINTYASDDITDEEVMEDVLVLLEEEVLSGEAIVGCNEGECKLTRLDVLNTVINALIPGHRIVLEVNEEDESIECIYIAEV